MYNTIYLFFLNNVYTVKLTTSHNSTLYMKMKTYKINYFSIIFSFTLLFNLVKCQTDKCYHRNDHLYEYFASKTIYNHVSSKYNYTLPCKLHKCYFS